MPDKRNYQKIHIRRKKAKHGNRGKRTHISVTLTEGLVATDKG